MVEIVLDNPLWVATFILVGLVFLRYSGFRDKIAKGLGFAVAAVLFLYLSAATQIGFWTLGSLAQAQYALNIIWQVIAWILLLIAAFLVTSDLAKVK